MSKKFILLVFTAALWLACGTEAATILLVSDSDPPGTGSDYHDDSLVAFLESLGHTVDTSGMADAYREGQNPFTDPAKLAAAEDADLVLVSRRTDSGSYDGDTQAWNELETPLLLMSGYLTRDSRWNWTPGGSGDASLTETDIVIEAGQEDHPFLTGLSGPITAFDWSTSPGGQCPKGVYLPNDDPVEGAILIGRLDGRPMLIDIPAGTTLNNGNVTGERRALLANWGYDTGDGGPGGTYSEFEQYLTDDYKTLLANVINDMMGMLNQNIAGGPVPGDGETVDISEAKPLSWTAGETAARHDVYFGTSFDDVNDADASDTSGIYRGRQNLALYTPTDALELGMTYYWRIDEVEANNTTLHRGAVWSFTVADFLLVDDFEGYKGDEIPVTEQIWGIWCDGLGFGDPVVPPYSPGNGTGSEVGDVDTASYTEQTITHGGSAQSMPYWYNNNKPDKAKYSEAKKTLTHTRDWTQQGVKALSIWFRGYPANLGGFVEAPAGTYTMTAEGADIWSTSDQFHFAFKELSGAGTIIAKVESVTNTDPFAKAGVMIRDSLDADAANTALLITPENGVRFQYRNNAGDSTDRVFDDTITAPYWIRLERTLGGLIRAYYSPDGVDWSRSFDSVPTVAMSPPLYIGLVLTSHASGVQCEAVFSNVTSDGTGPWTDQDIGLTSNQAEQMYVAIANNTGAPAVVYHEDPNATLIDEWTEWPIDLNEIADKGIDLTDVNSIAIGFGDRDNPTPGGAGKMYFDDIGLYQPKCVLSKVTDLEADLNADCVVDYRDLEIMVGDWLQVDYTVYPTTPQSPIAWWKLDNNANDSAGSNNGTPVGNPVYEAGQFGQAITLDGSDYIDCGNPSLLDFGTGDWSITAWVKTEMTGTGDANKGVIYAKGGDRAGGIRYGLYVNENQTVQGSIDLVTDDDAAKREAISSISVSDGEWHHIVGQREGGTTRVYIDGVVDGVNDTLPDGYDLSGTSQHNAYIGVVTDHAGNVLEKFLVGSIDDVRIYDYALSSTEIMSVMGVSELYNPLTSIANISDEEPANSKTVNFKDFAVLADQWLEEQLWPQP